MTQGTHCAMKHFFNSFYGRFEKAMLIFAAK